MKKLLALILAILMIVGILASCGAKDLNGIGQPSEQHSENETHGKIEAPDEKETENKLDKNPDKETDDKGQNGGSNNGNTDGEISNGGSNNGNTDGEISNGGNSDNNENEEPTPPQNENSSEGLEFSLDKSKKSYTLVGIGGCTDSDIVINKYNGLPVLTIAAEAFYSAVSVKSITIGDSVTSIKESAFEKCLSLSDVKIGSSVLNIESNAFKDCSSIKNIEIPDSVKLIGENAFLNCKGAKNISVPYDAIIGDGAFDGCKPEELKCNLSVLNQNLTENIKSLMIGGIETVSQGAFEEVKDTIEKITFDEGLKTIESSAFKNCSSLTSVTIPNSVTSIDHGAFIGCYSLKSATIPALAINYIPESSLEKVIITNGYIPSSGFKDCTRLTSVTIGDGVTSIGNSAFYNCSKLTSVTIGNGVTSIGSSAFYNCDKLTSITIPDSVTSIGDSAFSGSSSLTSVTIGNSVTNIDYYAFRYCSKLVEVINKSNLSITKDSEGNGYVAYYALEVHNGESKIVNKDGYLFYTVDGTNYLVNYIGTDSDITLPANYNGENHIINKYAFYDNDNLTSVTIPDSVTSIGDSAFSGCSSLTSVTIPDSVTTIGNYAFSSCSSLTSVTIPDSVTSIGSSAFDDCKISVATIPAVAFSAIPKSNLKEIVITTGNVGSSAFKGCSGLKSITIPFVGNSAEETAANSSTSFGYFFGKSKYTGAIETQQYDHTTGENVIYYIPASLKSVTITGGKIFPIAFLNCSNITSVTIGDGVTSIGYSAFYNCSSLTSVTIPDSVTSIGSSAFDGCSSLKYNEYNNGKYLGNSKNPYIVLVDVIDATATSFTIHNATKLMHSDAFSDCSSLTSVTIGNSITSIGSYAFYNCSSLTSVTIPDSLTSIGSSAFKNCSSLKSITIGNSVTSIGEDAFYNTGYYKNESNWENGVLYIGMYVIDAKTDISGAYTIKAGTKLIANSAFSNCSNLTSVTIPDSVTSIGSYAFYGCSSLTSIKYRGTEEQWNAISKGSSWNYKVPSSCVTTYNYTGE